MAHPLDGARERLKRADQNIRNLNLELTDFLSAAPSITMDVDIDTGKPIITDKDRKILEDIQNFLDKTEVSLRLRLLTGEIIHHFRSAFDHIAWELSSLDFQANSARQIQFPVVREEPICRFTKNKTWKICSYCRQIEGISSPTALARIDSLQPYHTRGNEDRQSLWIIHDLDIRDKHRELTLAVCIVSVTVAGNASCAGYGIQLPWEISPRVMGVSGPPEIVDMKAKLSVDVTLREFRGREDNPLIPTLQNLLRFSRDSVESFAEEFV